MISDDVKEKIEKGQIRIENGRLIGLGVLNNSIDITVLDELFDWMGKDGAACAVGDAISAIAQVLTECLYAEEIKEDAKELNNMIKNNIQPQISSVNIFELNMVMKAFIK